MGSYAVTAITAGSGLTGGTGPGATTINIGAGNGLIVSADSIAIDSATTGLTAVTSSNSGIEVTADGIRLLGGCSLNQVLAWDNTSQTWKCSSVSGLGGVTGTGTDNYLARWDGTSALQNSSVFAADSGNVGIGTSGPGYNLDVAGSANVSNLFIAGNLVSSSATELNILDGALVSTAEINLLDG
ncbi:MAG: hypothetical protein UW13_C0012G0018, partial [candidate division WWE3 bacterium GW2011_GWA1_43_94]